MAAAALALAGCSSAEELPADRTASFDPIAFFAGRTEGTAKLDTLIASPVAVSVASVGRRDGRGGLMLDQIIKEGGKAPRQRRWIFRPLGAGRFGGSLTDAAGPVKVRVAGPRATIAYRMKNGMAVKQQLALQADRRTLLNRLVVSRLGI